MPDFTEAEIRDARENPRPGDVWQSKRSKNRVTCLDGTDDHSQIKYDWKMGATTGSSWCELWAFRKWTRNATLIRRGA